MKILYKYSLLIGLIACTGCYSWSDPESSQHVSRDIWLTWRGDPTDQSLATSTDGNASEAMNIIGPCIFAVGFDENYIIAKQHPDSAAKIQDRLFIPDKATGYFKLLSPADTIWLSKEDRYFERNGHWYHISNGWNPPDSLKPYKAITYYYIIDLRNYDESNSNSLKVEKYNSIEDFESGREKLGVPQALDFTLVSTTLE